jgi:hypothetical protein
MAFYKLVLSAISMFFFSGCYQTPKVIQHQKKPEDAVKAFYEAISSRNLEKAKALSTDSTKRQLHLFGTSLIMSGDVEKDSLLKAYQLNFENIICSGSPLRMICKICCDASGREKDTELMQMDGLWFVNSDFGFSK